MLLKKFLALCVLVLTSGVPMAAMAQETRKATFVTDFNLQATTETFCITSGLNGNPYGGGIPGLASISTVGSSTTWSSVTLGTNAFTGVNVGDLLTVQLKVGDQTQSITRFVATVVSNDQITVNSAANLSSGFFFEYWHVKCGTTATDGWLDVSAYPEKHFIFQANANGAGGTGIDWRIQCRDNSFDTQPVQVFPATAGTFQSFASGSSGITTSTAVTVLDPWDACRIGMKQNGGPAGTPSVTGTFQGRIRH